MRGDPPTVLQALVANAAVLVLFVGVAVLMVKRARDPNTVPRDKLEEFSLLHIKNPTRREKLCFVLVLAVALAAPWLTRWLAG